MRVSVSIRAPAADLLISRRRLVIVLAGMGWLVMTVALYRQEPWATWIWPWAGAEITYIFLASIAAAIAAPLFWIAIVDEPAALAGMAIDGVAIGTGVSLALLATAIAREEERLLTYALGAGLSTSVSAAIYLKTRSLSPRDASPQPRLVRISFAVFMAGLLPIGTALVLRREGVFPWTLPSATSTIIGAIFLGAGTYFAFGLWRGRWAHAGGQLAGFLAYDVVLIGPYLRAYRDRNDGDGVVRYGSYANASGQGDLHERSLLIYIVVLIASALVASYYLFAHRQTRIWPHIPALFSRV